MTSADDAMTRDGAGGISRLRRVGEVALWLIVILLASIGAIRLLADLRLVVLPVLLAIVLATFLMPPTRWLRGRGWPHGLAALVVVVISLLGVVATFALLLPPVVSQFDEFDFQLSGAVDRVENWIRASPLPVSTEQISGAIDDLQSRVAESFEALARGALTGAIVAVEMIAGFLLAVVVLFFLLKDGEPIWAWAVSLAPPSRREGIDGIGKRSWQALGGFVRGQFVVALFDAVLIGLAMVVIGVPLALPLSVLVFFGAFVPVIGATVTGLLAVLVALVSVGLVGAIATLAAIVVVQQIEGSVLQPVVIGRAVDVHPLAILLGVTAGAVLAGIIGAMVAAPAVAVAAAVLRYLREGGEAPDLPAA